MQQQPNTNPPAHYIVQVKGKCKSPFDECAQRAKTIFIEYFAYGQIFAQHKEVIVKAKMLCFGFQSFIPEKTEFKVLEYSETKIAQLKNKYKKFTPIAHKPRNVEQAQPIKDII